MNTKDYISQLSVNLVLFRFKDRQLEIATVGDSKSGITLLPGGYVLQTEDLEECAQRTLKLQTDLSGLILRPYAVVGGADRQFGKEFDVLDSTFVDAKLLSWISQRFVTICYYSVLNDLNLELKVEDRFDRCGWVAISNKDELSLDHAYLVTLAEGMLKKDLNNLPILQGLMQKEFTMPDLQGLYEVILNRPIDRGNFRQSILKSKILSETGNQRKGDSGRPAKTYNFNQEVYLASLTPEIKLGF